MKPFLQFMYKMTVWACGILASVWIYKTTSRFCSEKTDDFTIGGIHATRPFNPKWQVHALSEGEQKELHVALDQEYYYLARGNQAFAFLSADGNYIVKFFDQKVFSQPFPWNWIPSSWIKDPRRIKKAQKKLDKLQRDFTSYKIAFDELKDETGLVLVHLNTSDWIQRKLKIYDKLHIAHWIDLDRVEFIAQKRADLVYPHIEQLMREGKENEAKEALSSILHLFAMRCQKGINDSEPDLDKNFGFIGKEAIQIDAGRFALSGSKVAMPPIKASFKAWLAQYPSLAEHFDKEYENYKENNLVYKTP